MKNFSKLTLTIISILLVLKVSYAQKSQLLLKGGINHYSFRGTHISTSNDTTKHSSNLERFGYNIGYGFEYLLSEKQSILLGLEFSRKRLDNNLYKLNNPDFFLIDIPISYNHQIFDRLKLNLGVQTSYLLNKRRITFFDLDTEEQAFRNFDFGFNYGIRFQICNIDLELKNVYGIVKFLQVKTTLSSLGALTSETYARSRYLSLSCSYVID